MLGIMLAVPAATAVLGTVPGVGTSEDQTSNGSPPIPTTSGFWVDDDIYEVIVTFSDPCVVEHRLALERGGMTDEQTLVRSSKDHKAQLEEKHVSFMQYVWEKYPEFPLKFEFTTVLNGVALTASGEALEWIAKYPGVATIEQDTEVKVALDDSVPLINADDMWAEINGSGNNITGTGIVVALLDTGIDYSHPDLGGTGVPATDLAAIAAGTHKRIIGGWNVISNNTDFWDVYNHGTHCAGIIGANGTVVGVAPECDFLIYKVLSDSGSGPTAGVIRGIELATDPDDDGDTSDHADVISMSLGGFGHPDDAKCRAVDNSMDAGVVVAVAAVNDGSDYETIGSPGCARKIISVGATSKSDKLASFSSVGPTAVYQIKPDVTAPGVKIYSTSKNNGYRNASGTSMATPHVAGVSALLAQSHPDWTSHQVKQALMGTAKDVGYNQYRQGAGRIDAMDANSTVMLADPPSASLGRLSALSNITTFKVNFENLASGWTNATLNWSLKFELTPLFADSGNSTDLSSMITADTTSVNISGNSRFTVRFTVTYDQTASVGHHLGEFTLTSGGNSIRVPLAFYIRSPVLLVDDDNTDDSSSAPYNNHNPYRSLWFKTLDSSAKIGDALNGSGMVFDVVSVRTWYDGPDYADLSQYRVVIWNTGFDYAPFGETLTDNDLKAINQYVNGGGNLWLGGSLILYDLYGTINQTNMATTDMMRATFGMSAYTRHAGTPDPLGGTPGTFMASDSYDVDTGTFGNADYGVNLTPADGSFQILTGSDTDNWGAPWTNITSGIARGSGTNKTVFTAFEFGHIKLVADQWDLVDEILTWIDLRPNGTFSHTGNLMEGSELSFSARVLDIWATESYSFEWDFDYQGTTFDTDDTGKAVTHSYPDDGTFTVGLRVLEARTNSLSPVVTSTLDVTNQAPEAHINTSSPGNESSPIHFWGNVTDPGTVDTFTWEWDFDYDGITFIADSTLQNATYTYLDDGVYTAALQVTDDEGLTSTINTSTVVINNLPPFGNIFTPGAANEGDLVPFTATVDDPSPLDTINVSWDFEYDGRTFNEMANGTSVSHTYMDDGSFTVFMRLRDDDGGVTNVTIVVLISNVAPTASFESNTPVLEGGVVDFNATVEDPGGLDTHTFDWDFDYDGLVFDTDGTRQNVSWQYYQDGEYTVALRVTDDDGASVVVTKEITITNSAPEASIGRMDPFDEGEAVTFTGTFNDSGRFDTHTFAWDFGDDTTSTDRSPTHAYKDDGTYTVTFTVTDDAGDFGTTTRNFVVLNVAPNATVAASPDHIKENQTVFFQAEGRDPSSLDLANLSYTWNFGDGESSNRAEVFHTYVDDGCFTVTLTVQDDDGGVTSYTLHIIVDNVAPSVEAGADREYIKEGEFVNFTALIDDPGPLDTHTALWDFDDGATSDQLSVTHRFIDDGNFIVVLTVTDNSGGTNTTTFRVAVSNVRPILTATANITEIDEGDEVAFTVEWTDPGLDEHTVSWDFGDGTESSAQNPIHQFTQDGTFTVLVTVIDDDGGRASKPFVIEVNNVAPVPTISVAITQIDENGTVQFAASATDKGPLDTVTFHWDFGDGSDPDDKYDSEPNHRYVDNGVFRVTLRAIDSDGAISSPAAVLITVNNVAPKNLRAAADLTQVTVGKAVTFSAWAEDDSPEDEIFYTWNFGDLDTSTEQSVSHIYLSTGDYDVILIVSDDDGGQTRWDTTIVVLPDMDGDGIPDDEDKDKDGDGYDNNDDDYPTDPSRYQNWTPIYLGLLIAVVVLVAVAAYVMRPRSPE